MTEIRRGSTAKLTVTIYDFDQTTKIDPDSQTVKLIDCNGKQVGDNLTPTKDDTGVYHVFVEIDTEAKVGEGWYVDWTITKDSKSSREVFTFEVIA